MMTLQEQAVPGPQIVQTFSVDTGTTGPQGGWSGHHDQVAQCELK